MKTTPELQAENDRLRQELREARDEITRLRNHLHPMPEKEIGFSACDQGGIGHF